jgi:hypothetical protein
MIGNLLPGIISEALIPFDPTSISGCKLWLDAADTSTISLSGSAVTQWDDKSGNSRTFTQGTSGNRPSSGTRSQNGRNVLDFDGGDFLNSTAAASVWKFLSDGTENTIFLVATSDIASTFGISFGNAVNTAAVGFHGARFRDAPVVLETFIANGSGIVLLNTGGTYTAGTFIYFTTRQKPADATAANRSLSQANLNTAFSNNTSTATPSGSNPTQTLLIGGSKTQNGDPTNLFDGGIGELLMYDSYLSNTDTSTVQSYLSTKWGI